MSHFLPFYSPNSPKNQNFEKMKITSGDIIILYMCTKNFDQMMYGSWDMMCDRYNYFSFWAIFCPFTPITARKIKILKKKKKHLKIQDYHILYIVTTWQVFIKFWDVSCPSLNFFAPFGMEWPFYKIIHHLKLNSSVLLYYLSYV